MKQRSSLTNLKSLSLLETLIDNKSRIESIINRIFILYMMLERNREKEEEGIEKIGQKKKKKSALCSPT